MKLWKWINTLAFSATVAVNAFANLFRLGGHTTGEVSAKYPTLFTPTPAAFAIWGVIYILMACFVVWQWGFFGSREANERLLHTVGIWFAVGCLMNIAWIFCWHLDYIGLSTVCIAGLLLALTVTEERLRKAKNTLPRLPLITAGFELYFGWIIAATIANVAVYLKKISQNGFGRSETFWTVTVILIGTLIGLAATARGGRRFTGFAVAWAFAGILFRHVSAKGYALAYPAVALSAALGALVLTLFSLLYVKRPFREDRARSRRGNV